MEGLCCLTCFIQIMLFLLFFMLLLCYFMLFLQIILFLLFFYSNYIMLNNAVLQATNSLPAKIVSHSDSYLACLIGGLLRLPLHFISIFF